jgi:hypothetical protein
MIQRIQTVYLALGALALVVLFFLNAFWQSVPPGHPWVGPLLAILGGATALTALGTIFAYADRRRQRSLVVVVQVTTVLLMVAFFGSLYVSGQLYLATRQGAEAGRILALALPILAYVLFYLARRGIEHDIQLVRSMDRLR